MTPPRRPGAIDEHNGTMNDEASPKSPAKEQDSPTGRIERIERDEAGELIVHLAGRDEPVTDARAARCFPWSLPEAYVSIRTKEGKEIALLESLDELDDDSREVLEAELCGKVFNPKISRVLAAKNEFGVTSITAETDRGEVTFQIRSREDVRLLTPVRAIFRDVDGNNYELADVRQLDAASQKHLSEYF